MINRALMQTRTIPSEVQITNNGEKPRIVGYFAVFNSNYEIEKGYTESIAPGAFTDELHADVRALIDHESRLVLGRTTAATLELREDEHGLWGGIDINPNDTEAMNLYARVQRGMFRSALSALTSSMRSSRSARTGRITGLSRR